MDFLIISEQIFLPFHTLSIKSGANPSQLFSKFTILCKLDHFSAVVKLCTIIWSSSQKILNTYTLKSFIGLATEARPVANYMKKFLTTCTHSFCGLMIVKNCLQLAKGLDKRPTKRRE
jgi:hypothetical protein